MQFKGVYSPLVKYQINDVVGFENGEWFFLEKDAPAGTPPTNTWYWNRLNQNISSVATLMLSMGSGGGGSGDGLTDEAKMAILTLASKVAYIDNGGETYYNALYEAFYGSAASPVAVTAEFEPGSVSFAPGTAVDDLKQYLTVTAVYSDGTTAEVTSYTLNGTLSVGTNTVTVIYGALSTTFQVTITSLVPAGYTQVEYINSAEGYADTGLNETEVARAEYKVQVTNVYYTKGNHILSAMNTFFPYLSGSNAGGDYSQIRAKLKGSETVASGSSSYTWSKDNVYTLEGYVGETNDVKLDGETLFSMTAGESASESYNYQLFATLASTSSGYQFHGRLFYMKIYDSDGELLRNYIPCKNSNNVAGLYDTVTETFLSSANQDSAFIAGPTV